MPLRRLWEVPRRVAGEKSENFSPAAPHNPFFIEYAFAEAVKSPSQLLVCLFRGFWFILLYNIWLLSWLERSLVDFALAMASSIIAGKLRFSGTSNNSALAMARWKFII